MKSYNAEARHKIALVILSSFLVKLGQLFLPPYCLLPRHLVEILFVSDFKSIKPRLESQVLFRSQTHCQAVKVHWLPVDIGNSEYSRRC